MRYRGGLGYFKTNVARRDARAFQLFKHERGKLAAAQGMTTDIYRKYFISTQAVLDLGQPT